MPLDVEDDDFSLVKDAFVPPPPACSPPPPPEVGDAAVVPMMSTQGQENFPPQQPIPGVFVPGALEFFASNDSFSKVRAGRRSWSCSSCKA